MSFPARSDSAHRRYELPIFINRKDIIAKEPSRALFSWRKQVKAFRADAVRLRIPPNSAIKHFNIIHLYSAAGATPVPATDRRTIMPDRIKQLIAWRGERVVTYKLFLMYERRYIRKVKEKLK